jgi:medium-chain acyl-[acyl-carrier-protein] hydrolase
LRVDRKSPWVVGFSTTTPVRQRIFCFAFAGGGASVFRRLAEAVPAGVEIAAVQLPGREDRYSEPALTSIRAIAAALLPQLRPHFDLPFTFFGHSMGALVAFELAREMRRRGESIFPEHIVVSGRRAPGLPARRRDLHVLPSSEFWSGISALQGTPPEVLADRELRELVEPILRADFEACETHTFDPEPPLDIPITVMGGSDDRETTAEELQSWREHTRSFGGVRMVSGHHFYLLTQWDTVAEVVAAASTARAGA